MILGVANNTPGFPSPYFGFQLVCGANPCTTALPSVSVSQLILDVAETTAPTLLAGSCGPSTPPPPLRPDHQGSLESSALSTAGAPQTFNSASGQVPVSGIGQHTVSCNAFNNPVEAAGNVAESSTGTWSIKIGQPTVMGIAFFKLVACGALARVSVSRSPGE